MSETSAENSSAGARRRAVVGLAMLGVLAAALFWLGSAEFYPWAKAIHVIAVISWMAGMLYLPRLFVYHADVPADSERSAMLKVMERKLLRFILNPAMTVAWAMGLWLAWTGYGFQGGWLHAKLALVLALSGVHGFLAASVRRFAEDQNKIPSRNWRIINEVPTLLMIGIVILVVVKPF